MKYLVVVDMQNDFINGSLGTKEAQEIIQRVIEQVELAGRQRWKVYLTRDTHYENYMETLEGKKLPVIHCQKGTKGWDINQDVMDAVSRFVADVDWEIIDKETFGYLKWAELMGEDVEEIVIVGLCTDICVVSNALILRAIYPNVPIKVVAPACAGVTPETHDAALKTMTMCQIDVA